MKRPEKFTAEQWAKLRAARRVQQQFMRSKQRFEELTEQRNDEVRKLLTDDEFTKTEVACVLELSRERVGRIAKGGTDG